MLAIVNGAAMNLGVRVSCQILFSLDLWPGVGLLDQMVTLFLVFKGISILFSIVVTAIYIPTNTLFSNPLQHLLGNALCSVQYGSHQAI